MKKTIILIFVIMIFIFPSTQGVLGDNLVSYYSLDIDGTDDTGNNNDGTPNGNLPSTIPFIVGNGNNFDGTGDFYNISDSTDLNFGTGDFTIAFFINDNDGVSDSVIMSKGYIQSGVNNNWLIRSHHINGIEFFVNDVSVNQCSFRWTNADGWKQNADWHVVIKRNATDNYIYINGTLEVTNSQNCGDIGDNSFDMFIGRSPHNSGEDMEGQLDEIGIWKRDLSELEINQLFQGESPIMPPPIVPDPELIDGLVAYYSFDDNVTHEKVGLAGVMTSGGVTSTAGILGNGVAFDGTNDFLSVSNNLIYESGEDKTVMCWVTSDQLSGTMSPLSNGGTCQSTLAGFGWCWDSTTGGQVDIGGDQADQLLTAMNIGFPSGSNYNQFVMVLNGTNTLTEKLFWYVNAELNRSDLIKDGFETAPSNDLRFGERATDGGLDFAGNIDECGIWNRSLTSNEISTLYNGGLALSFAEIVALSSPPSIIEVDAIKTHFNTLAGIGAGGLLIGAFLITFCRELIKNLTGGNA